MPKTASRKLSHYFSSSKRKGREGLPLMSVTMHDGLVRRDSLDRKTDSTLKDEEHLLIEPYDIAYNMMRMWQGALGLADNTANVSPAYGVMRPKPTVDPRFAKHWFKSERGLYMLWAYSYGLTEDRLRLYPKEFLRIPVEWPDIHKQCRIADILDVWDAAIASEKRYFSCRERQRRELSRSTFPLLRDLDPKKKWDKFELRDLADIIRGVAYDPAADLTTDGVGVLTAAHVQGGELSLKAAWQVVRENAVKARQIIREGDFLIAMSNGSKNLVGKAGLVRDLPNVPLAAGAFCSTARPKSPDCRRLLDHAFASQRYAELLHVELAGSSIGNLTDSDLRKFVFFWSGSKSDLAALDLIGAELRLSFDRYGLLQKQKAALAKKLLFTHAGAANKFDRRTIDGKSAVENEAST